MKGRRSVTTLIFVLLSALFLLSACGQPTAEEPIVVDETAPVQWQEPALESLVREALGKPDGEIYPTDLDHIWGVELFGESHIFFNAEGGYNMYATADGYYEEQNEIQNPNQFFSLDLGTYIINGETFGRGSIASLSDFANFRNLRYLYLYSNDLQDVSGLSGLNELVELRLIDNCIQDVHSLAQLRQIDSLNVSFNHITDASPLFALTQLSKLNLRENEISSLEGIEALSSLTSLDICYNQISSLDFVSSMPDLQKLRISGNDVQDLQPITGLKHLRWLYFAETQVNDLTLLQNITSLQYIDMRNLDTDRIDFAPLATLPNLYMLDAGQSRAEIVNLRSLAEIPGLKAGSGQLELVPSENIPAEDIAYLRKELPGCSFYL